MVTYQRSAQTILLTSLLPKRNILPPQTIRLFNLPPRISNIIANNKSTHPKNNRVHIVIFSAVRIKRSLNVAEIRILDRTEFGETDYIVCCKTHCPKTTEAVPDGDTVTPNANRPWFWFGWVAVNLPT
jgi:hypothetical protein